jgi:RimJ/RimL family protein N-acetyltransferase
MKIIDAYWEKRNLGLDAYEICLDNDDVKKLDEIIKIVSSDKYNKAYLVIKMPVPNIEALHYLEDNGFSFMEIQFHMVKSLKNYTLPVAEPHLKHFLEQREIKKYEEDWKAFVDLMTDNMFHSDRIYLDPKWAKGTSCKRYKNWIMDLVNNPESHLFAYYHQDIPVGFGLIKINEKNKIADILLEGIFEQYQGQGFGYRMVDCALKKYQNLGIEKVETARSSNNLPMLNLDYLFAFKIKKLEYVLRKFNN